MNSLVGPAVRTVGEDRCASRLACPAVRSGYQASTAGRASQCHPGVPLGRTLWVGLCLVLMVSVAQAQDETPAPTEPKAEPMKQVIGATAPIVEVSTGGSFMARIDTGAKSCSLHIEEIHFEDASNKMRQNIGKLARFRVLDSEGKDYWIEEKILATVQVKTSGKKERRYKVWLTLCYGEVKKRVKVTLNDRSQMEFPLLIGRNFLCNDFVVDVSIDGD